MDGSPLGPARKPYDSLESIHSLLEVSATPSTLSESMLEDLEETTTGPTAPPLRPVPEHTGTRELGEIHSPPVMPDLSPQSSPTSTAAPSLPEPPASSPMPPSSGLTPADDTPLLQNVLRTKARLGSTAAPVGVWAGAAALVFAVGAMCIAALFTALVTRSSASPAASAPVASVEPAPTSAPAPQASAPDKPQSLLDRARAGERAALDELEKKPAGERSVDESVALTAGKYAAQRNEIVELGKSLVGKEPSKEDVDLLQKAARESALSADAIRVMANLNGQVGPDLLYEVWTGTPRRTPATELAEALVYSPEVRKRASPALAAALDLRAAEACEDAQKVLPRVEADGDRRCLVLVGKLLRKTGCGDNKRQDCYPCLRNGDAIKEALKAVRMKAAPRY